MSYVKLASLEYLCQPVPSPYGPGREVFEVCFQRGVQVGDLAGELAQGSSQEAVAGGQAGACRQGQGGADLGGGGVAAELGAQVLGCGEDERLEGVHGGDAGLGGVLTVASKIRRASRVSPVRGLDGATGSQGLAGSPDGVDQDRLAAGRRTFFGRSASITRWPSVVSAAARRAP